MSRRRRRERPESFSFDSFLDVVANVCGIIIKLILVAWAGARMYQGPTVSKPFVPEEVPAAVAMAAEDKPDPLEGELAREVDAVALGGPISSFAGGGGGRSRRSHASSRCQTQR